MLTDAQCEVLQKSFVLIELIAQIIHADTFLARLHCILKESSSEIIHLSLVKLHPILGHTGPDDLPQLRLIDHTVSVGIVNLKQEGELLLIPLVGELVHRLEELLQRDGPGAVLVEDPEGALHEERLQQTGKLFSTFVL